MATLADTETAPAPTALAGQRWLFIVTILTGSFLLFLIQPMLARMALPRLGGAPAVWNSAMLVYQALLLAGYAYAHRIAALGRRTQAGIHIGLFALALLWLPVGLAGFQPPTGAATAIWVPWLLLASIGPLFFMVSAQAPLMQRWYALSGQRGEPYALYAASNFGSFAGLIAYPLLVEPMLTLNAQSTLWSALYVALLLLVAACGWALVRAAVPIGQPDHSAEIATTPAPALHEKLRWVLLAAIPSGLMLSTTTHLTTDLVAMPLIWAIPLGLYLLSFTVAFAVRRAPTKAITLLTPSVLLLCGALAFMTPGNAVLVQLGSSLVLLFAVAVALHGEMYRTRPAPEHLTNFYLMMSIGGALGGLFCALIAPLVFDWTWEHPILILAAAALIPQRRLFSIGEEEIFGPTGMRRVSIGIGLLALAVALYIALKLPLDIGTERILLLGVVIALGVLVIGQRLGYVIVVAALLIANGGLYNAQLSWDGLRTRSYFGIYSVNASEDRRLRWLSHGTTMHGMQLMEDPTRPISYYGATSGVGLAFSRANELYGPRASIGVVGLGTGTLGCYRREGQDWRFFEIDPTVIGLSKNGGYFSYLDRCAPNVPIKIGDARLTIAKAAPGSIDMLAVDAFSSDAIPVHLLTRQAFDVYARALSRDGMLLIHISNRYIDLEPVLAAEAGARGWAIAKRSDYTGNAEEADGLRASHWVAISPSAAKLRALTGPINAGEPIAFTQPDWSPIERREGFTRWTDDFASILPLMHLWRR
ncbi:hypothetical protein [Novosphingopyxis sp.]|uniref:hypothetical protein n=1 Tax=Novosphingopyxis sp. TaxID=2709690 RepID=UPI003B5CEC8C